MNRLRLAKRSTQSQVNALVVGGAELLVALGTASLSSVVSLLEAIEAERMIALHQQCIFSIALARSTREHSLFNLRLLFGHLYPFQKEPSTRVSPPGRLHRYDQHARTSSHVPASSLSDLTPPECAVSTQRLFPEKVLPHVMSFSITGKEDPNCNFSHILRRFNLRV